MFKSGGLLQVDFIADHPFLFFLRDLHTGLLLFHGRLANPMIKTMKVNDVDDDDVVGVDVDGVDVDVDDANDDIDVREVEEFLHTHPDISEAQVSHR